MLFYKLTEGPLEEVTEPVAMNRTVESAHQHKTKRAQTRNNDSSVIPVIVDTKPVVDKKNHENKNKNFKRRS